MSISACFLISLTAALLATPFSMAAARAFQVLDWPEPRKMHTVPIPRLGGLAVYGAVTLSALPLYARSLELGAVGAAATLVFLIGLLDDAKGLGAAPRLAVQAVAAALAIAGGVRFRLGGGILEAAATAAWLIGVTNAVNFVDGIDGLAAALGASSALFLGSLLWPSPSAALAAAVAGACLGFVPYNWHPAKVFLGDGGATSIGFLLAALSVLVSRGSDGSAHWAFLAVLPLGLPVYDLAYTTVSRVRRGRVRGLVEWLEYAAKDHVHHRLIQAGLSAPQAAGALLLLNLWLGLWVIAWRVEPGLGPVLLAAMAAIFSGLWLFLEGAAASLD